MNATSIAPAPTREEIDAALAAAGIPVGADAAPLVVAAGWPVRIVFATRAACALLRGTSLEALGGALFVAPGAAGQRLADSLARLEPETGARLERLRLAAGPRAETVTFQLRRLPGPTAAVAITALGVRPALLADPPVDAALRLPPAPAQIASSTRAPRDAETVRTDLAARFGGTPSVRFLWQTDAEGRFVSITSHLCEAVGCMTQSLIGDAFVAVAARLGLDPEARLATALGRRETWSGVELAWPVRDADAVLPITVGALPSFAAGRQFDGFRGFGVIHLDRVRARPAPPPPEPATVPDESVAKPQAEPAVPEAPPVMTTATLVDETRAEVTSYGENVVRLRSVGGAGRAVARSFGPAPAEFGLDPAESVELSPGERMAFREIARALGARAGEERPDAAENNGPARDLIDYVARASGSLTADTASAAPDAPPVAPQPADAAPPTPTEPDPRRLAAEVEAREARALLDTTSEALVVLDDNGKILSINRAGRTTFGYEAADIVGKAFTVLFETESQPGVLAQVARLRAGATDDTAADGEILGRTRQGSALPLQMQLASVDGAKIAATLRDLSAWRRAERELKDARREAERASALKSEFLAKVSHEIRTPLNAILGFAEVIMDERFGPVGNERYRDYLKDIHASGTHVMSLVNDLLDLSKIEAGRMELDSDPVDVNRIVSECVSLMQPQANTERVIVRLSLASRLPKVLADERSLRQIVLNLLSNAVKFNEPGGQVIVSTALTDAQGVVLRVRDTGIGMTEADLEIALEPFRQVATARGGAKVSGTGLGLPLTKALVEANRASFTIRSRKDEGTLVEVAFPVASVVGA